MVMIYLQNKPPIDLDIAMILLNLVLIINGIFSHLLSRPPLFFLVTAMTNACTMKVGGDLWWPILASIVVSRRREGGENFMNIWWGRVFDRIRGKMQSKFNSISGIQTSNLAHHDHYHNFDAISNHDQLYNSLAYVQPSNVCTMYVFASNNIII